MHEDYNETLRNRYEELRKQTRAGTLSLDDRIKAIDEAVSDYVAAQDEDFEYKHAKGGHVPIQLRNDSLLDLMADLLMHEYLTWSHPDKMSIVDDPILSDSQTWERRKSNVMVDEISVGDIRFLGKRKVMSNMTNDDGEFTDGEPTYTTVRRILQFREDEYDVADARMIVHGLLEKAKLTDRQAEAIRLIYWEDMTQEQASDVMGIGDRSLRYHLRDSFDKIYKTSCKTLPNLPI